MLISEPDLAFLRGAFPAIEGWCVTEPAWLTVYLMRLQQARFGAAPALEIGVFKGKYLSVLHQGNRGTGEETVGIDTYEWAVLADVERGLRSVLADLNGLRFVKADSTHLTTESLLEHLSGRQAGFISVDDAHTPEPVHADLELCESVLARWGVIAIDDFLNPEAIGVADGAMRYLQNGRTALRPVCLVQNKLFVTREEFAGEYETEVEKFLNNYPELPYVRRFLDTKAAKGLHWVKQRFLGRDVWTV
ncbi:MAG: class I SAM-dependent methyltransferase [Acidobacteria bacterium]|nr:class I SAM-dependent methyltransferase [Acidobacteriota bacterium]